MARAWYGGAPADFTAIVSNGYFAPSGVITLYVWDARTGGAQLTELLDVDGAGISSVTTDAYGTIPRFQGPDGHVGPVYVAPGGVTPRAALNPGPEVTNARLAVLEVAGGGTLDGLSDVSTSGATTGKALVYNGSAWAPGTVASTLVGLADVDASPLPNGGVPVWKAGASKFEIEVPSAGDQYGAQWVIWQQSANAGAGAWFHRGSQVVSRPTTLAFPHAFVWWDTTDTATISVPPSLAVAGDKWTHHGGVTVVL